MRHLMLLLNFRRKKEKTYDFQINQTYKKHAVTTVDRILIKHYRLDKNMSQRVYKHQRIRDMQHLKDLLEKNGNNYLYTRLVHASISLDIIYVKLFKTAGKHMLNNFSRIAVLGEICDC